ncbi:MAG: hypothetical protein CME70_23395 [Halobacteriovorax sp.]|nr:hypothetical protein [Halobacteriovorax sp.]|tara:strand:+ start:113869 stop:114528 length:660 start_codon:yes stop_codon:yes gene_type:complete
MELEFGALHSIDLPIENDLIEKYSFLLNSHIEKAVGPRVNEFLGGRICAHRAAASLGVELKELLAGEKREPLWPRNLVGSITHTKKMAMALVDLKTSSKSVGIDAEEIIGEEKIETIEKMVATKKDLAFLRLFSEKLTAYTVLFCAKEALYKLVYPLCEEFFGFEEAELKALDLESGEFILKLDSKKPALSKFLGNYRGQFYRKNGHIISVIRLASDSH